MKNQYLLTLLLLCPLVLHAQEASEILASAASKLKAAGGIYAEFTYEAEDDRGKGTFQYKSGKFVNDFGSQTIWYNGKTMWSLDKGYKEVTVTTPAQGEIATVNPYYFLTNYKNRYTASLKKGTSTAYEVVLNATEERGPQIVRLKINKSTYSPEFISMVLANGHGLSISITTYETGRKYSEGIFSFNASDHPEAEVVDLR